MLTSLWNTFFSAVYNRGSPSFWMETVTKEWSQNVTINIISARSLNDNKIVMTCTE